MGRFVPQRWQPDPTAFGPRSARAGGSYHAFVPDLLVGQTLSLAAQVAADVSDAERAMSMLDAAAEHDRGPHRLEVLARLLLRAEAVGSSQIEGLQVGPRRLALADFNPELERDGRAQEVVGNVRALQAAWDAASQPGAITVNTLCEIHALLMANTRDAHLGGHVRTEPNWIGGHNPLNAEFVPPPHEAVPALLEDLCAYLSGDDHPPLVQAALAHAQFETIHPFADGNGRAGRALVQLVLRRRGLCRRFVPPISLVLATWSKRYVDALMAVRVEGPAPWAPWIELLAQAAHVACEEANRYDARVEALVSSWCAQLKAVAAPRADAAVWALLPRLPAAPFVTTRTAVELTGRSNRAIDGAIDLLVQARVLKQVRGRLRDRVFEAVGVFDLVTDAERALASPDRDTKVSKPVRPVPQR